MIKQDDVISNMMTGSVLIKNDKRNERNLVIKRVGQLYEVYDKMRMVATFGSFENAQDYVFSFDSK